MELDGMVQTFNPVTLDPESILNGREAGGQVEDAGTRISALLVPMF